MEQCAKKILMVRPKQFSSNNETITNNSFQRSNDQDIININRQALIEFDNYVQLLNDKKVDIFLIEDTDFPVKPDAVYPNNWVSFHKNKIVIYPMFSRNRRYERRIEILKDIYPHYIDVIDYSKYENKSMYLEGTGSLVLDRINKIAFASISERTNYELVKKFSEDLEYNYITFNSKHICKHIHTSIYHTNVMMSICEEFCVICADSITDSHEKKKVIKSLINKELLFISIEQMNNFAGNIIQIKNILNEKLLLISKCAYNSLSKSQIAFLEKYNELVIVPLEYIEKYGGGSARCMVAEIF